MLAKPPLRSTVRDASSLRGAPAAPRAEGVARREFGRAARWLKNGIRGNHDLWAGRRHGSRIDSGYLRRLNDSALGLAKVSLRRDLRDRTPTSAQPDLLVVWIATR